MLVDGKVDDKRTDSIRHQLYEIEWETREVLCSIVRNRVEWESPEYRIYLFIKTLSSMALQYERDFVGKIDKPLSK